MEKLKKISQDYELLQIELFSEMNTYLENNTEEDISNDIKRRNLPEWKKIEKKGNKIESLFIDEALKYGKENDLTEQELVNNISIQILEAKQPVINYYLLIRLMWAIGEKDEGHFSLKVLEKVIRKLLSLSEINEKEEYYIESFIDIWNFDTDELIPIDILESIILLEPQIDSPYGALIKATSYLSDHPKEKQEKVLVKARNTKSYKNDEYFRKWID